MKLRITTNSIRLRVRKSDLQALETAGAAYGRVDFPHGESFRYGLALGDVASLQARWADGMLLVELPATTGQAWMHSDQVGLAHQVSLPAGGSLELLVEKDFPCKDREEDIADTFFELDEGNC
ncbi:MAG: hypothetical protein DA408_02125 [Bacteroidetes bacterium]|nr:MAG: hypothetical protein C7N36_00810 [Bacteroidota bacterium]PTM14611.1 MAG: hypothetical protein DA408_02125 [Bacteroidota bacterium]